MADVRTYIKTSGKHGVASIVRVDAERVRVNWRDSTGKLITSQVMPAGEAQTLAGTITDFLTPAPQPEPEPEPTPEPVPAELATPVLSGTAGNGTISLSWTITSPVTRWEVWVNNHWAADLPADARSWSSTGLTNGVTLVVRVVAYDERGYKNSNTITLTPASAGPTPVPPPASQFTTLVLDEQFDTLDTSRWGIYTRPGNHASEPGIRAASAIKVENGQLVITAANGPDGQVVTGGMSHRMNYHQGRWEIRVRTDPEPTMTMSGVVLLWPEGSMRPGDGEIDFMETLHKGARKPCYSFVHYAGSQNLQKYFKYDDIDAAEWHVWGCEWTPEYVRIFCDDKLVGETTDRAAIPTWSKGLHICLQYDAFGKRPVSPTRMVVDWVRVYQ